MENNLLYGSNAIEFNNFENGVGFLDSIKLQEKPVSGQCFSPNVLDLDSFLSILGSDPINQKQSHQILTAKLQDDTNCTYSLDDIIDFKVDPATSTISLDSVLDLNMAMIDNCQIDVFESPIASPQSASSDEVSIAGLNELLSLVSPDDVLQGKAQSSPLAEFMYTSECAPDCSLVYTDPLSVDSGFASSEDEQQTSAQDLLLEMLGGKDPATSLMSIPEQVESSTLTINASDVSSNELSFSFPSTEEAFPNPIPEKQEESKAGKIRKQPAKRKSRTPEQKLRKKAQNRKAASRYRDKKKDELEDIFTGAAELEQQNSALKEKVEGLEKEIGYLKNLMLDVIKARLTKGISPPQAQLSLEEITEALIETN